MLSLNQEAGIAAALAIVEKPLDLAAAEAHARRQGASMLEVHSLLSEHYLRSQGYFLAPKKVTYKLRTPASDEAYLASLPRAKRKAMKAAEKNLANAGISIKTEEPISLATYLQWEQIYDANISAKRLGFKRISIERFNQLQERTIGVFAWHGEKLCGGILLTKKKLIFKGEGYDKLSISLSSSAREHFKLGINEALNLAVIRLARERGIGFIERGMDANLYGSYLSCGLYLFKKSLGYRIAPRARHGMAWIKILDFSSFQDHTFFISQGERGLEGNLFFKEELPNLGEYADKNLVKLNVFCVTDNVARPCREEKAINLVR